MADTTHQSLAQTIMSEAPLAMPTVDELAGLGPSQLPPGDGLPPHPSTGYWAPAHPVSGVPLLAPEWYKTEWEQPGMCWTQPVSVYGPSVIPGIPSPLSGPSTVTTSFPSPPLSVYPTPTSMHSPDGAPEHRISAYPLGAEAALAPSDQSVFPQIYQLHEPAMPIYCIERRGESLTRELRNIDEEFEGDEMGDPDETQLREMKLARNRAAAHKFRTKVRTMHTELYDRAYDVERKGALLLNQYKSLQAEVLFLKCKVLEHANCSDPVIQEGLMRMARDVVSKQSERGY